MSPRQSNQDRRPLPALRERAIEAYDSARDARRRQPGQAGRRDRRCWRWSAVSAAGVGALLAALLPRTRTEDKLLGKVGGRITDGARAAADAAKEAGREKLAELNITRDAGASAVQSLVDGLRRSGQDLGRGGARRGPQQGLSMIWPVRTASFDASGPAMSKLHFVFGGRVKDPHGLDSSTSTTSTWSASTTAMPSAEDAWRGKAQRTVDDAEMKYVVVHLHRLLEPDVDGISRPKAV